MRGKMPYIKWEIREEVDEDINNLLMAIRSVKDPKDTAIDGIMNYVITRMMFDVYGGGGYAVYNRAMGVFTCSGREFYRRVVAPYEDKKVMENGDVYLG